MAIGFRILPLGAGPIGESPAWLNPRSAMRALTLGTHLTPVPLNLRSLDKFFGAAGEPPRYDWPNPRLAPRARIEFAPLNIAILGTAPVFGTAGPNPARPLRAPQAQCGRLNLPLLGQDDFFGDPGQGPRYDWPNPRTAPRGAGFTAGTDLSLIPPVGTFDWPLPRIAPRALALGTHLNATALNLLGLDQFFDAPGLGPNYLWPNPRPLPPQPAPPVASLNLAANTVTATPFVADSLSPPAAAARPTPGHLQPMSLPLAGKDVFFGLGGPRYDWPNPRIAPPRAGQSLGLNLAANTAQPPLRPIDWPNPKVPPRSLALSSHTASRNLGTDTFFAAPGQGPRYDWPNPRTAPWRPADQPRPLRLDEPRRPVDMPAPRAPQRAAGGHLSPTAPALLATAPVRPGAWPNPPAAARQTEDTTRGTDPSTFPDPGAPRRPFDWPNPRIPARAPGLETWVHSLNPLIMHRRPRATGQVRTQDTAQRENGETAVRTNTDGAARAANTSAPRRPAATSTARR